VSEKNHVEKTRSETGNITAIELAEYVIKTTSILVPIVSQLDGDDKQKIIEALTLLQKKAIAYTIQVAKRSQQRRMAYWKKRGRRWVK